VSTLEQEFETLRNEAQMRGLLQTDVLYRRTDGQPSMKKRTKWIDGVATEVLEDKPIKSVHFIRFGTGMILRVKRSKKERKANLQAVMELAQQLDLQEALKILNSVSGLERGKNVDWEIGKTPCTFEGVEAYLKKVKEDDKKETAANPFADRPSISDDLLLVAGWQ
jgi:hypothetical protein